MKRITVLLLILLVFVLPCFAQGGKDINARVLKVSKRAEWWGRVYSKLVLSFTDGDATPSVYLGNVFKTANTNPTAVTMLDDGITGQQIVLIIGDANTTFDFSSTNLKGNGGVDWTGTANDLVSASFDGTNWYCAVSSGGLVSGDLIIVGEDPAIILDGSTASDTDFWLGVTADEEGDDDDKFQIGGGTTKGTNPFLTMLTDGTTGFEDNNLTNVSDIALDSVSADAGAGLSNRIAVSNPMMVYMPGAYCREIDDKWQLKGTTGADRYTVQTPARLLIDVDDTMYLISSQTDLDLSAAATWDTQAPTDYTVAANRAGVDFYIYAIQQAGTTPLIEISDNSSAPDGYTTADSRRVGGFHGLCVAVGTIGGHALTDFVAGDILPDSIWDYDHRPVSEPEGMVFSGGADLWVDIYLASGTGASTLSAYGGTISDNRPWLDFVDDSAAVKKRLLRDREFQIIASGSNEETNIAGSAYTANTGGHSDTAGRRMISYIGVEDACGATWQCLDEQSYRYDGGDHTHTTTITHKAGPTGGIVHKDQAETNFNATLGSAADETVNTSSVDPAPSLNYYNLPGSKGSLLRQGTLGDVKLLAGGDWSQGAVSGSRGRFANTARWTMVAGVGCRFASDCQ